jgi:hypothetical protein
MSGATTSRDPGVIAAFERNQARHAVEAQILAVHRRHYPYQSAPPSGAQIDATLSALSFLLRSDARPVVLAAFGLEDR